jgi:hypothetical protein
VYKLAVSLPDAPLVRFRAKTAGLLRATEVERLVIQRIGQDVFRDALMDYWGGRCPITGITDSALLRASHIVPWSECSDEQRLDVPSGTPPSTKASSASPTMGRQSPAHGLVRSPRTFFLLNDRQRFVAFARRTGQICKYTAHVTD